MCGAAGTSQAMQDDREVLLEFIDMGRFIRVNAVDPVTGTEVAISGPRNAGQELLTRTAVAKLDYRLKKLGLDRP